MFKKAFVLMLITSQAFAQHKIKGTITERQSGKLVSIPGASVGIIGTDNYVISDSAGVFEIRSNELPVKLISSFIGYKSDTTEVTTDSKNINIILVKSLDLKEVNVQGKKDATVVSTIKPINTEKITTKELLRAACCNLSEAFETNPSVNVAYKDAVTGVKEIQMLGLSGTYVQMMAENIPDMRGLSGIYGLTFVPGPWIESIQVSKGSGSVVNGYESTTGQINVEYKKPLDEEQPKNYFNLFADELGAVEANVIFKRKLGQYWGTMLMLHGRNMQTENDRNKDGFMDVPNNSTVNIYNRYEYHNNKHEGQIAFKLLADDNNGGQTESSSATNLYQSQVKTRRAEVVGKLGFIFPEKPYMSFGNIFQATIHDMKSSFGLNSYIANERSVFYEGIYANIIKTTDHQYKAGFSFRHNNLEQHFPGLPVRVEENVPGVFGEYTFNSKEKLTLIFGGRADWHNGNRLEVIPRFHGKYNFTESFIVRISAGKSYRTPYIIADHLSVLASSRAIIITENILSERAWNYGANMTKRFVIGERDHTFSIDAYRTNFVNQLVVDTYSDSTRIQFYNLDGKSYSNSLQFTLNLELKYSLALRLGYKIEDVKSTFNGVLEQLPLVAKNRALGTIAWSTKDEHWKVDYTLSWEGTKKLQNTYTMNDGVANDYSPSFVVMNLQVTKAFRKFEIYGGAENLLDYRQEDPIIHPEDPFGNSFDATNIWGPVQGRRIYAGIRMSIN
jgi:outer membrane receptor for ferrienterochelin and colicins